MSSGDWYVCDGLLQMQDRLSANGERQPFRLHHKPATGRATPIAMGSTMVRWARAGMQLVASPQSEQWQFRSLPGGRP